MHGFEVGGIVCDELFEAGPLLEHWCILVGGGRVVFFDELVELSVEQLYFVLGPFVDLTTPIHQIILSLVVHYTRIYIGTLLLVQS